MIIALLGASGSGKSTIENELATHHGFKKIISCTTRKPRNGEVDKRDYNFIGYDTFIDMINSDMLAEYDEYSQGRLYGTLRSDYMDDIDKVVVLTPNGLRQLKQNYSGNNIFSVLVNANLGTRIKRYINRCGIDKFDFDDKNEICARVERDFAMFLGLEKEVDLVIENNEETTIEDVVDKMLYALDEVNN